MASANIGVCFAPSVMRGKDFDLDKMDMQSLVVISVVDNYDFLFVFLFHFT